MNNLQLKIILSAVDKLLTPMKRNLQGSKQLAAGLQQAKKYAQELNNQNLDVTKYRNLSRSIGITSNELKDARARAAELAKGINETAAPTKAMVREFERAKTAVNELQVKQNTQISQQQRLRETMKAAGINVKSLASEQRRLKSEMQSANQSVDEQRKKLDQLNDVQKRLNAAKASYQKTKELQGRLAGTGATMIATGGTMGSPVIAAVKQYADFEDAMKGVARQVNGARDDNGKLTQTYYDMAKAIKAISERLPSENGAIDIAALVEGAARMGIQGKDNLLAFAETSAKASKAFELPAGDLAENMGKIANLYKIPIKDIERLGDTINWLDDNAQSKGSDIIDVLQRMGGVADKLDYKKAAALGSTFLSLGAQSDVAATASVAMVRELSIATMQSKRFQAGMETLGLSSEKMEKSMSKDAMGTIITVLEQIKKLPKDAQMRVTTQLFGKEYGKDAAKLANNLDELHKQLKLVNDEKARGSMQRESDIDADSISAQWTLLKTGIANTFSGMGSTLRAPLMDILGKIKQITIATRQWVEEHPQLTGNILKALAAVSAITVTVGGLSLALAAILGPLALSKFIFTSLGITIPIFSSAVRFLLSPLAMLRSVLLTVGAAMMTTPIGWIIAGLAAISFGVVMLCRHWEGVKAFLGGFFDGLWSQLGPVKQYFETVWTVFKGIGSAIGWVVNKFSELITPVKYSSTELTNATNAGKRFGEVVGEAINIILYPLQKLMEGIQWVIDNFDKIGGIGAKVNAQRIAENPALASGVLTGNYGPVISTNNYTPVSMPKPTVNSSVVHAPITIVQQPGQNDKALAGMIQKHLDDAKRKDSKQSRNSLSDRD